MGLIVTAFGYQTKDLGLWKSIPKCFSSNPIKCIRSKQDFILITLGGETSYKCCAALGINQLELVDEVAPAIALSKDNENRFVVTKSGNLGGANTLIDILDYFQEV